MAFNSLVFIAFALPLILAFNFFISKRFKTLFLLLTSILMYAWVEPKAIIVMMLLCGINYYFARYLDTKKKTRKSMLIEIVSINVGLLVYFKYYGGFLNSLSSFFPISFHPIIAPLGFSFFLFHQLSYLFDVYYHHIKASHSFLDFACYTFFFPKMIMGPITPYPIFMEQLNHQRSNLFQFTRGVKRFIIGLGEKVILASMLFEIMNQTSLSSQIDHWIILFAYTLYIYFDFAGYSHMAIGISQMLGFDLVENFKYPYISCSISEFWRRWHISLGMWFRNYVYIPLGGNRVSKNQHILNLAIVWCLTGMWHGSTFNFLLWGFYFFVLLTLEKYVLKSIKEKLPTFVNWLFTFLFIMFGWIIFKSQSLFECFSFMKGLFFGSMTSSSTYWILKSYGLYLILSFLCSLPILPILKKKLFSRFQWLEVVCLVSLFILSIAFLVNSGYQTFIYTAF